MPDASASAHAQYGISHAQKHAKPITDGQPADTQAKEGAQGDGQDKVKQAKQLGAAAFRPSSAALVWVRADAHRRFSWRPPSQNPGRPPQISRGTLDR